MYGTRPHLRGLTVGAQVIGDRRVRRFGRHREFAAPSTGIVPERETVGDDLHDERVGTDTRLGPHERTTDDAGDRFGREPDDELELVFGDDGFGHVDPQRTRSGVDRRPAPAAGR